MKAVDHVHEVIKFAGKYKALFRHGNDTNTSIVPIEELDAFVIIGDRKYDSEVTHSIVINFMATAPVFKERKFIYGDGTRSVIIYAKTQKVLDTIHTNISVIESSTNGGIKGYLPALLR